MSSEGAVIFSRLSLLIVSWYLSSKFLRRAAILSDLSHVQWVISWYLNHERAATFSNLFGFQLQWDFHSLVSLVWPPHTWSHLITAYYLMGAAILSVLSTDGIQLIPVYIPRVSRHLFWSVTSIYPKRGTPSCLACYHVAVSWYLSKSQEGAAIFSELWKAYIPRGGRHLV